MSFPKLTKGASRDAPLAVISGHGGGRWYDYYAEYSTNRARGYRHMLVNGTSEPLSLRRANPEHARGEANMEIRNARHVSNHGLKGEGNHPIPWVRDSDRVLVFGCGGNAAAYEGTALFRIERTPNRLRLSVHRASWPLRPKCSEGCDRGGAAPDWRGGCVRPDSSRWRTPLRTV